MAKVILNTEFPGAKLINKGKVRDIYDAGEYLLLITTDRISAFDVVMAEGIPYKGIVLNQISKYWFDQTKDVVANHFITDQVKDFPAPFNQYEEELYGRAMLVKKAQPFPVECIVRGYLAGSGWKEYQKTETLHGTKLPTGMQNSSKLDGAIFTPSTKAEEGHDENISFEEMLKLVDEDHSKQLRDLSVKLYTEGSEVARGKGIIIADTKFEFGLYDDEIMLIDEALTPDSSRFWPADLYEVGKNQPSLDKQYLRDYLETLDWDKTPPAPKLPAEIVENISLKYQEIFKILTGKTIQEAIGE